MNDLLSSPNLTYRELKEALLKFNDEQLDMNVTVHLPWDDEYYPVPELKWTDDVADVLDPHHPYLELPE